MDSSLREIRSRIRSLRAELSQTKSYYNNKITLLRQIETQLRRKPAVIGVFSQKLAAKQEQKLEETKDKLSRLEEERDKKIQKLENELNVVEKNYKESHNEHRETNRKSKEKKLKNTKDFLVRYRYLFIGLAIIIVVVNLIFAMPTIVRNNEISQERNRDYYINVEEQFNFDCNIKESSYSLTCEERIIEGVFSSYESVKFSDASGVIINNDRFAKRLQERVPTYLYQTSDFDALKLKGFDAKINITLENTTLNSDVAQKNISIHYSFTDTDIALLTKKHSEWLKKRAEEEAKAQQEAEERRIEEEKRAAEQKAAEEKRAAEQKAAEEKRAAEQKAAEEKRAAEQKAAEEAERARKTGYIGQYIEDPNSRFADDDFWIFNADGTAKFSAHERVTYTLESINGSYLKFRATSWYMDWILEFSSDWSTLEATNDFNGERSYFVRM